VALTNQTCLRGGFEIPVRILLLVIVADAAQNGMSGEYRTVTEGFVLVATLVAWSLLLDWLAYRCRWASRLVEPPPLPLVRHGEVQQRNLRRQRLTEAELQRQLRQQGIESLAEVKLATLSHARTPQCLRPSASPSVQ
jgi:uncharacterized membrane protein YcaP (DUF421 family)